MYGIRMLIRPTGGLTFRRLPGSILHIGSYTFVPPTTLSGFLRRLVMMLAAGPSLDLAAFVKHQETEREMYVLPRDLIPVGAYTGDSGHWVHTTKRQGIRDFKHDAFSRLYRVAAEKEVYQLHDWDYLMCEDLTGYLLGKKEECLSPLLGLGNRGCKLGKEGYAFIADITGPTQYRLIDTTEVPSTIVPGRLLAGHPCDAFQVYRHDWTDGPDGGLFSPSPSPVRGFVPFMAGLTETPLKAEYYTDGTTFIPKALVDILQGEVV
ncbi:MAG: hypothetical protein AB1714_15240 [Acidobacteriota bacterium]